MIRKRKGSNRGASSSRVIVTVEELMFCDPTIAGKRWEAATRPISLMKIFSDDYLNGLAFGTPLGLNDTEWLHEVGTLAGWHDNIVVIKHGEYISKVEYLFDKDGLFCFTVYIDDDARHGPFGKTVVKAYSFSFDFPSRTFHGFYGYIHVSNAQNTPS